MGRITKVFGQHDERTLIQLEDVASRALRRIRLRDGAVVARVDGPSLRKAALW